jgi:hypothetical protein
VPAALAAIVLAAGCRRAANEIPEPDTLGPVRELSTPAAEGSSEPNLAVGPDGAAYLSWIEPAGEGQHALRFAVRPAGGVWSEARTVARGPGWFVNWADFPAVFAFGERTLAAHWLSRTGAGTYEYEVRVALSTDRGLSWTDAVVPHRDTTPTEHGFVSFFPWPGGRVGVVWLDGRKTGKDGKTDPMALMQTTIGADGALGPETVLDPRVCECCQTSATRAAEGLVVAYRDRSEAEVRDVATVRYAEGAWSSPAIVAADRWEINGCPVNGPAVTAEDSLVAVAWFSAPAEKGRVQVAFSTDSGRSYGAPVRVDDGRPVGRVDVALFPGGDALVSWIEQTATGAELRVRRVSPAGPRAASLVVAPSSAARSGGFPRIERAGGQIVMAWRDAAEPPRVHTAVLDIP